MEASRSSGDINSVNTMEAMNKKIMAMDMARAEIRTVDSQESLDGGVTVLVTGHLTVGDGVRREFSRSFLLAPQEKGYFVLNDMFRYNGEDPAPAAAEMVKLLVFQCGDDNYGRPVVARGGTKKVVCLNCQSHERDSSVSSCASC